MLRGLSLILGPHLLDDLIPIVYSYIRFEGIEILTLRGHTRSISSLAVFPDETGKSLVHPNIAKVAGRLVSGSHDGTILIWDLFTGTSRVLEGHTKSVTRLAILPDETGMNKAHPNVASVAGRLASASFNTTIRICDLTTGISQVLRGHTGSIMSLAVIPDETGMGNAHPNVTTVAGRLASGSYDNTIRIWDLTTGTSQVLEGHTDVVTCLVVLPNNQLASGSSDDTIRIWDLTTGTSQELGHNETILCLAVLPNNQLASGSFDNKTICLWDLSTGMTQLLNGHTDDVTCLAVLPDGRLVSGSCDKTIRIWDLFTETSQVLDRHTRAVMSLAVLPDGRLASGSFDGTIRIYDLTTGMNQVLEGHTRVVESLAVLPDGRLASGSDDKTIRIWV